MSESSGRDLVAALMGAMPTADVGATLRFGVVRQVSPLRVEVGASGLAVPVAALLGLTISVGDGVALLQQGRQFLLLGRYAAAS